MVVPPRFRPPPQVAIPTPWGGPWPHPHVPHLKSLAQTLCLLAQAVRWRPKAAIYMNRKHETPTCCTEHLRPAAGVAPHRTGPLRAGTCRGQAAPLAICDGISNAQKKAACRTALSTVNAALA
jgi:hypothetical protein